MSSQAGAWTSYVLTLGQPALTKDLVGTFDPVEDIASVGTVDEQGEFVRRHRAEQKNALGRRSTPSSTSRAARIVESTTGAAAKDYGESPLSGMAGASIHVMASFPVAARRTVCADFPHTALGQGITLSPTEGRAVVRDA